MKKQFWKRLKNIFNPYKKIIIIIIFIAFFINIIEVVKPYLIKIIIDDYLSIGIFEKAGITISMIGIFYIAITLISSLLDLTIITITNRVGENVSYELREKLYKYIQYANIKFHDKAPAGKLFVRMTNDIEDISSLFKECLNKFVKNIIMIIAIAVMMFTINYQLALISMLIMPLLIITSIILTKLSNYYHDKRSSIRTKINTFLSESIYGIKLIKVFNKQKIEEKQSENLCNTILNPEIKLGIIDGILPGLITFFQNLGISIICFVCIYQFFSIKIEVGILYVFITYLRQIFYPINRIIENFETIQSAVVAINKVYEIIEKKEFLEDYSDKKDINQIKGKIEFKNVWFAYEGENWVLKDVSFIVNPGESIALVGKTGSGKTTITNLLNRFYEIQKGEILLDGINIKEINIKSLRQKIGVILQDPFIFARSIKENIQLSNEFSKEKIQQAISLASADEFIKSLPNGIDEIAKERGEAYSAGQKQLIAFARVFAHNPSIFILDEATANIDTKTEEFIQKSVDLIAKNKTSIFIAHRLSTVVNVDKIIVLSNGKIVEQGNHKTLIQQGGLYSKLYEYGSLDID